MSLIPMGGYVKMMGEESPIEGGEAMPYDPKKAFALKPLWARFLIVFAGPGMNFVLAVAIFAVVFATFGRPVWPAPARPRPPGRPAAAAPRRGRATPGGGDGGGGPPPAGRARPPPPPP